MSGTNDFSQMLAGTGAQAMFYAYLKIAVLLTVSIATLVYSRQLRHEADMQALKWDVEHPPKLEWVMEHPREALQRDRIEVRYLHRLIRDLDN